MLGVGIALGAVLALPAVGIAREPPPELLTALDQEADGAALARAAERMLRDYRSHSRAGEAAEILAEFAYARGEYATAGRHFQTAAELAPDPGEASRRRLWRARALAAAGDLAGARKQYEELTGGKGPLAAEATLGLADVALAEGKAPRAIELYETLTARGGPAAIRSIALGQLAVAYERAGREDQALAASKELVRAYPSATEAAAARERIRRAAKRASEGKATRELPPPAPRERASGATAGKGSAAGKSEKAAAVPPPSSPKTTQAKSAVDESGREGSESGAGGGYSLQLGAFGDHANAADLARRIESFGLESVRIEEEMRGSRRFYLVRAGSYDERERAERDGERLLTEQGIAYRIVER